MHAGRVTGSTAALGTLLLAVACTSRAPDRPPPPLPGVGVAANGELVRSSQDVLRDAAEALRAAASVHVTGDLVLAGRPLDVDLIVTRAGGLSGLLRDPPDRFPRARVQVVRAPGDDAPTLVHGDAGLAEALGLDTEAAVAGVADDRYRAARSGSPVAALTLTGLAALLVPAPGAAATAPQGSDVNGTPAVLIASAGARVWVAGTGTPLPLRVAGGPTVPGLVDLDVPSPAPSPALVPTVSVVTPSGSPVPLPTRSG